VPLAEELNHFRVRLAARGDRGRENENDFLGPLFKVPAGEQQVQDWDILINFSDDMLFIKKGFDQIIIDAMKEHFPDTDGVLHFHDGHKYGAQLMTMSIMGKKYYDRFHYIYHPDYISLWSDNEAMDVAKLLGKYKYMGDQNIIFNHNHPMHQGMGASNYDAQLKHTESFFNIDKATYNKRKENKFDLP